MELSEHVRCPILPRGGAIMSLDKRFFRPLGFLSIFAAGPTIDAGLQSIPPFFRHGDYLRAFLGSVITFAALLLLAAGILLCAKLPVGRTDRKSTRLNSSH